MTGARKNYNLSKGIKIAIYSGTVPSTTFIERLIQGIAKSDFEVFLFGLRTQRTPLSSNIREITYTNSIHKLWSYIKFSLLLLVFKYGDKIKLDRMLRKNHKNARFLKMKFYPVLYHHPDIFHIQWAKSIEDWMWVQEFGIKIIVSLRGAHINYSPLANPNLADVYSTLFPKVDGFHAVSSAISLEAMKYGANEHKIKVIYSGLDLKNMPLHLKKFDSSVPLKIISIGRTHWKKGYSYAMNSASLLKLAGVDFHYTIIGVEENEELIYQRSSLALEKEVSFINKLPFHQVVESMQKADVLLLSSVEEGIANVVLESMALGTLVISTKCGGMDEVIIDNENGVLVPVRDSMAMAEALKRVAKLSEKEYQEMTSKARATIENRFNDQRMVEGMKGLYLKVLNNEL